MPRPAAIPAMSHAQLTDLLRLVREAVRDGAREAIQEALGLPPMSRPEPAKPPLPEFATNEQMAKILGYKDVRGWIRFYQRRPDIYGLAGQLGRSPRWPTEKVLAALKGDDDEPA